MRRNLIYDVKARVLPFTVLFMLVIAGLSAVFVLQPEQSIVSAAIITDGFEDRDITEYYKEKDISSDANLVEYFPNTVSHSGSCSIGFNSTSEVEKSAYILKSLNNTNDQNISFYFSFEEDDTYSNYPIIFGRFQNTQNGYWGRVYGGTLYLYREVSNSVTLLDSQGSLTWSYDGTWYKISMNITSTSINIWCEHDGGTAHISDTDSQYSSGDWGFGWCGSQHHSVGTTIGYIDDFSYGDEDSGAGGNEEQIYFNITSLDANNRITFGSIEQGKSGWSNQSGNWGNGAMLAFTVQVNASTRVEDIYLDLQETDISNGAIEWEDVSIDTALDNSTFPNDECLVTAIDQAGGDASNISLNASWDADWGTNPFPITNSSLDGSPEVTLYIRFKVNVDGGVAANTYSKDDVWLIVTKYIYDSG